MANWQITNLVVSTDPNLLESTATYQRTNPEPGNVIIDLIDPVSGGMIREFAKELNFPAANMPVQITIPRLLPAPLRWKAVATLFDASMTSKDHTSTIVIPGLVKRSPSSHKKPKPRRKAKSTSVSKTKKAKPATKKKRSK